MFLAVYESRKWLDVWVHRSPIDYRVTGDNDEGVYHGFGDTPLAAIADYNEWEKGKNDNDTQTNL